MKKDENSTSGDVWCLHTFGNGYSVGRDGKDIKLIFIMGRLNDNASSYETRYTCVTFYLDVTRGRCCRSKVVLFYFSPDEVFLVVND